MNQTMLRNHFWSSCNTISHKYEWLSDDIDCDVLVIGGGVSGALAAYSLAKEGVHTVVVSAGPQGFLPDDTASPILDYAANLDLITLSEKIGKDKAILYTQLCAQALDEIEALSEELDDFGFVRRDSFWYAEDPKEATRLHTEYLMRRYNGFDTAYLEAEQMQDMFSFRASSGLLSRGMAGELDVYRFTQALLQKGLESGLEVYENSPTEEIVCAPNHVEVRLETGCIITASKVVMATGFEQDSYLRLLTSRRALYCIATGSLETFNGYQSQAVLRNIAAPNSFVATAAGSRILMGGGDSLHLNSGEKLKRVLRSDRFEEKKYRELECKLDKMFCAIPGMKAEHRFHLLFGETHSTLPVAGEIDGFPNVYFNMPGGIHSILQSVLTAKMITALYQDGSSPLSALFDVAEAQQK